MEIEAVFPGFDYFGTSQFDGLRLQVPEKASGLRISLRAPFPEILNLQQINLFDSAGRKINLADPSIQLRVSSVYGDDDANHGVGAIRSGRPVHTKREYQPHIEVSWKAHSVNLIEILNRQDEFGRRSATINVAAGLQKGLETIYCHDHPARVLALMARLAELMPPSQMMRGLLAKDGSSIRRAAISCILEDIDRRPSCLTDLTWVLPLLDIYGGGGELDVALLSAYLAGQIIVGHRVSSLWIARKILPDADAICRSEVLINHYLESAGVETGVQYTRHGLLRSRLRSNAEDYLALATSVISVLRDAGYQAFLCYGTLLGVVRDRDFIGHDDDVDIAFVSKVQGQPGSPDERDFVLRAIVEAGFKAVAQPPGLNFHVSSPVNPAISVDVFPTWMGDGSITMYMDRMQLKPVDATVILPLSEITFRQRNFPVPAKSSDFLSERYGSNWGVGDRFFEWPYPLVSRSFVGKN